MTTDEISDIKPDVEQSWLKTLVAIGSVVFTVIVHAVWVSWQLSSTLSEFRGDLRVAAESFGNLNNRVSEVKVSVEKLGEKVEDAAASKIKAEADSRRIDILEQRMNSADSFVLESSRNSRRPVQNGNSK